MNLTHTNFLNLKEKQAVFKLWNQEYPKNLSYSSIMELEKYLSGLQNLDHVLVKNEQNQILGWYIDFKRDNEVWFAMILDSTIQGKRIGTRLLDEAKKSHKSLNGWVIDQAKYSKIDSTIYRSPLGFYLKNNFIIVKQTRLELPKISAVKITWKEN